MSCSITISKLCLSIFSFFNTAVLRRLQYWRHIRIGDVSCESLDQKFYAKVRPTLDIGWIFFLSFFFRLYITLDPHYPSLPLSEHKLFITRGYALEVVTRSSSDTSPIDGDANHGGSQHARRVHGLGVQITDSVSWVLMKKVEAVSPVGRRSRDGSKGGERCNEKAVYLLQSLQEKISRKPL